MRQDYGEITRLASGTLSAQTILNDSQYLVDNFVRTSDDLPIVGWKAFVDGGITEGVVIQSLSGIGGLVGKISGQLIFASISPQQLQYIFTDILQSRHINAVTLVCRHQRFGDIVINCRLQIPPNIANVGAQQTDLPRFSNVSLPFNRGVIAPNSNEYSYEYSSEYS